MEDAGRGGRLRGASTISQQVAKNLFLWSGQNWFRKGLEAWFTVWIELFWPKQRILEVYLNVAQFGRGTWGVEAASRRYFGKSAASLTRYEAALLAAVLPSPTRYRVVNPGPYVRQRQQWILGQMHRITLDGL
jgi:monofunctional biosynthetic peptidoglycan transglycosylase